MSSLKFDPIWKLMLRHPFQMDPDSINESLNCVICNQLLIDPYQSACGCQYCRKCIEELVRVGDVFCPGGKTECSEEYLVMEGNLFRNIRTSNQIYKLRVLCPNQQCQTVIAMMEMEEHLRLCTKQSIECPYTAIGCNTEPTAKDSISVHLNNDALPHSQLLIELIQNLKNEVNELRNDSEIRKLEMSSLREELRMNNEEHKREMEGMKEESRDRENRITTLEEELRIFKNEMEARTKRDCENREAHMNEYRQEIEERKIEKEYVVKMVDDLKKDVHETRKEREECTKNSDRKLSYWIKWNHLCPHIDANFVWRFDNCSVIGTSNYSESFYSNDYKLRLWMHNYDNDNIGLWCVIMRGDNDDKVQWPMTRAVTVAIIDQETLMAHKSDRYKHDTYIYDPKVFMRPKDDTHNYIGSALFIKYLSIKDKTSIMVNDSIIVSCVLTDT